MSLPVVHYEVLALANKYNNSVGYSVATVKEAVWLKVRWPCCILNCM